MASSADVPAVAPSAPLVRDVIFTLTRGGRFSSDFAWLRASTACTRKVMKTALPYDFVAFHEGNVPPEVASSVQRDIGGSFRFVDARPYGGFSLPEWMHGRLPRIRRPSVMSLG